MTSAAEVRPMKSLADVSAPRLLVFRLDGLRFALRILNVENIVELSPFAEGTDIARHLAEACGSEVPLVDLRDTLGTLTEKRTPDVGERYFVIVVETECRQKRRVFGLVADRVAEIVDLDDGDVRVSTLQKVLPNVIRIDEHIESLAAGRAG
jgi:chemotaxis signal transduction protein